jgi:hypothetical protein
LASCGTVDEHACALQHGRTTSSSCSRVRVASTGRLPNDSCTDVHQKRCPVRRQAARLTLTHLVLGHDRFQQAWQVGHQRGTKALHGQRWQVERRGAARAHLDHAQHGLRVAVFGDEVVVDWHWRQGALAVCARAAGPDLSGVARLGSAAGRRAGLTLLEDPLTQSGRIQLPGVQPRRARCGLFVHGAVHLQHKGQQSLLHGTFATWRAWLNVMPRSVTSALTAASVGFVERTCARMRVCARRAICAVGAHAPESSVAV